MYEYVCIMKFRVDVTSSRLQLEFSNNQAEENIHCFRESLNRQCDFFYDYFLFPLLFAQLFHIFYFTIQTSWGRRFPWWGTVCMSSHITQLYNSLECALFFNSVYDIPTSTMNLLTGPQATCRLTFTSNSMHTMHLFHFTTQTACHLLTRVQRLRKVWQWMMLIAWGEW